LLGETLEIHTLELGWYNLQESELETASLLDRWLYWLLHAHQYDAKKLGSLFPQPEFQKATDSIDRIAKKTEDKAMYDTREKAIRDQQWILNAARREGHEEGEIKGREEGKIKGREEGEIKGREEGEIKLIQTLQEILGGPVSDAAVFQGRSLEQLRAMTEELRKKIQRRT
jgi:flagellar biosynthesis/type III secretory pathway protein FliH